MNWEKVRLGDIAEFSNGINFGKDDYGKGIKIIGVSNFGDKFSPEYDSLTEVKEEVVKANDYLYPGDMVFVRSNGNKELVGRCMLIDNKADKVTYSGFCIRARLKDPTKHNPIFWTYHFKNQSFRKAMAGTAVGANIQNLSQGRLADYVTTVPDYDSQVRIAQWLSVYDNLIKNNKKQIKLLEEAAERLYREWFVDLHFPGYEDAKIIDGVPEGWKYRSVREFGEVITGKTPSTSKTNYYGGNIPFVTIPDMHGNIYPLRTEKKLTKVGADLQKNKYLPVNSVMVSCIATVGLVNITVEPCQTNQQINSVILNDINDLYFFYESMLRIKALLDGVGSNGATMTNVNKTKFSDIKILYPGNKLILAYEQFCKPVFNKIYSLSKAVINAESSRDLLLPKLMNGEIEV